MSIFISYNKIEKYFSGGKLPIDINGEHFYVSSIADILYIVEQVKKDNIKITLSEMTQLYEKMSEQFISPGRLCIPDVHKDVLIENMFEDKDGKIELWVEALNKKISPRFSLTQLALKLNEYSFWHEQVFHDAVEIGKQEGV